MSLFRYTLNWEPFGPRLYYVTWNTAFEATPAGGDTPTQGDDRIRELKEAMRERFEREHFMNLASGLPAEDGEHLSGSAKGYRQTSAPTLQPDGTTALAADDAGRIWFDSDSDDIPGVYDGTGWVGFVRENRAVSIQGTLAVSTDVVPPLIFPRAATLRKVSARVITAPVGASLIIDINRNGANSIFASAGDRITSAAASNSDTSSTFDGAEDNLADDDYLTIDIDQIGSTTAGADLSISVDVTLDPS